MVVNQKQIASIHGVTTRTIRAWVRDHNFPERKTDEGLMYRVPDTISWRITREAGTDYQAERTRLTKEQADKAAIDNAVARGELIATTEVAREWASIASNVRQRVLSVPRKVAPHCVGRSQLEIEREIDAELKGILRELAGGAGDSPGVPDAAAESDGQ